MPPKRKSPDTTPTTTTTVWNTTVIFANANCDVRRDSTVLSYTEKEAINDARDLIISGCEYAVASTTGYYYDIRQKHSHLIRALEEAQGQDALQEVADRLGYAHKIKIQVYIDAMQFDYAKAATAAKEAAEQDKKRQREEKEIEAIERQALTMGDELPFEIKYTNHPIPPEAKKYCNLYVKGPLVSGGRQLMFERVIDKDNIERFTEWCKTNNKPELFHQKVGLNLATVSKYFEVKNRLKNA